MARASAVIRDLNGTAVVLRARRKRLTRRLLRPSFCGRESAGRGRHVSLLADRCRLGRE